MEKISIRTKNFKLGFRLMKALKKRNIPFVLLDAEKDPVPKGIWLGTEEEVIESLGKGRGLGVSLETLELCIERVNQLARGKDQAIFLTFGVDPGPRPGLAWLTDGILIGTAQIENVDETVNHIKGIASVILHDRLRIRIGNGSPIIRNRIVNLCLAQNLEVQIVNENRTSKGTRRQSHTAAATRISTIKGEKIVERLSLDVTDGEIKDWQRRSRKASQGRITISSDLAKAVAVGRISIEKAISIQESRTL